MCVRLRVPQLFMLLIGLCVQSAGSFVCLTRLTFCIRLNGVVTVQP